MQLHNLHRCSCLGILLFAALISRLINNPVSLWLGKYKLLLVFESDLNLCCLLFACASTNFSALYLIMGTDEN